MGTPNLHDGQNVAHTAPQKMTHYGYELTNTTTTVLNFSKPTKVIVQAEADVHVSLDGATTIDTTKHFLLSPADGVKHIDAVLEKLSFLPPTAASGKYLKLAVYEGTTIT